MHPLCGEVAILLAHMFGRPFAALFVAVAASLVGSVPALAVSGSPYPSLAYGYDASSYQCNTSPPSGSSFAIIRDTGGRPFTTDSCAGSLWNAAGSQTGRSIYFNTGYSGAYRQQITAACSTLASTSGLSGKYEQAYAIGCSEAAWAVVNAPGIPSAWWADVETGNSWASSDLALNVAAIKGILGRLGQQSGQPSGIYSTRSSWQTITGGAQLLVPNWVVGSDPYICTGSGFSGGPVWLIQNGTNSSSGTAYDWNLAC